MSLAEFEKILPYIPKTGKLLEIGSFPFTITHELKQKSFNVYGVDFNYNNKKYNVVKCDIECQPLPFKDNYFDNVLMMQVLEHLGHNPMFALYEIKRVLKPKGKLILSTPNFFHLRNFVWLLFKGYQWELLNMIKHTDRQDYTGHIRTYSMKELEMILRYIGFDIIVKRYLWYESEKYKIGGIITRMLPWFRDHLFIVCEVKQ